MRSVFLRRLTAEELGPPGGARQFLRRWAPAMVGIAVIMAESTGTFSSNNTSSWLRPIAEWIFGPIGDTMWAQTHHVLRKSGHFAGYGTLCVLFLRGWLLTLARNAALSAGAWWVRSWIFAVGCTFVVASGDEWHQSFLPSRTGMFSDVVLDTVGGVVISGIVLWVGRRMSAN